MKTNKRIIIIAVALGLLTVIGLHYYLNYYLDERSPEMISPGARTYSDVVVADITIPQHTRIAGEMVRMDSIPDEAVHPEAARDLNEVVGGISRAEIVRDEQVLTGRVATEERRASLSYRIPENLRGIAIPVNEVIGVAGFVSPGDRVDVLISYNIFEDDDEEAGQFQDVLTVYTVIQNTLVLATGEQTRERDDEERQVVGTVTLAVTPEQAEVLMYANLVGQFHLTLRSPLDEEIIDLEYYNIENFETFRER